MQLREFHRIHKNEMGKTVIIFFNIPQSYECPKEVKGRPFIF